MFNKSMIELLKSPWKNYSYFERIRLAFICMFNPSWISSNANLLLEFTNPLEK